MKEQKGITRKQLKAETGVRGYIIDYLRDCNRLPIIKESSGKGFPVLFDSDSIKVIRDHLDKSKRVND